MTNIAASTISVAIKMIIYLRIKKGCNKASNNSMTLRKEIIDEIIGQFNTFTNHDMESYFDKY